MTRRRFPYSNPYYGIRRGEYAQHCRRLRDRILCGDPWPDRAAREAFTMDVAILLHALYCRLETPPGNQMGIGPDTGRRDNVQLLKPTR